MSFFVFFAFFVFSANGQLTINSDYGKYIMEISNIELCKGAKKNNMTTTQLNTVSEGDIIKSINGEYTVLKEIGPVMFKGKLLKWTGKRFESLLKYKSGNICEFSSICQKEFDNIATFSSTDQSLCTLQKGKKSLDNINATALGTYLLGESYFYGQYKIIMEYFTSEGNILCLSSVFTLKK